MWRPVRMGPDIQIGRSGVRQPSLTEHHRHIRQMVQWVEVGVVGRAKCLRSVELFLPNPSPPQLQCRILCGPVNWSGFAERALSICVKFHIFT
ncbi:Hypp5700 [Branchiostoma lanceolatum]|uniref:Hypp5700 protein n=1 Tax=Branchiostoma lanceolatum TaxID=7740 RepID=A0A8J9VFS2_BRALA|nr:Hypp5700 [Branchiostoma lanceolatum]